eukprot:scaffold7396_cov127-Skeletonema_menzelii.AAC.10
MSMSSSSCNELGGMSIGAVSPPLKWLLLLLPYIAAARCYSVADYSVYPGCSTLKFTNGGILVRNLEECSEQAVEA